MNLYIHIPFCASKCSYCHFYSICDTSIIDAYLEAVVIEIKQRLTTKPTTIYLGGGTPSILNPSQLEMLLSAIDLSATSEITLEAHPSTLTKDKITAYQKLGINRLSIGIQSWNSKILKHMGREYDKTTITSIITHAQNRGLTNINLDHIIAYPMQTDQIVKSDILTSLALKPSHISLYPLEYHPHTRIHKSPTETKIVRQFSISQRLLIKHGYRHYEELNFCKKGYECHHNLDFWQDKDYLGIGASAVSKQGTNVTTNTSNISDYLKNPTSSNQAIRISTDQLRRLQTEVGQRIL